MTTLGILLAVAIGVGALLGWLAKLPAKVFVAQCLVLALAAGGFFALTRLL